MKNVLIPGANAQIARIPAGRLQEEQPATHLTLDLRSICRMDNLADQLSFS